MSKEMLEAFATLEKTKGIKQDVIVEAIKAALVAAYKKNYNQATNVIVEFDERRGDFKLMTEKTVVEEVHDERLEISLKDALTINRAYELGDKIRFEVAPKNFGRIAAQTAKQVIMQHLREAERNHIIDEYSQYEDELITGTVERRDNRFVYVKIGNVEAVMPRNDQMPGEIYNPQDQIRVLVTHVGSDSKGAQITVSRTAPDMVKRLFEQEVPEIYDGTVEIVSIAREAGDRTKIAVKSNDPNIDPVGTCVGQRGARVQNVVNELDGENIDVVKYEDDPSDYIANALNPAEVIAVQFGDEDDEKSALVIVPDYQLSLAIGKKGQNVRLAARLTGYKIDIRPESEVEFVDESSAQAEEENKEAENSTTDDTVSPEVQDDAVDDENTNEELTSEEAEVPDEHEEATDEETVDSTED
ncbi:MAG: transcription termination factor NusA [Lactobacillus helsingborgensis]|uniref:transcription termination factor NusA n=1 Tax=Lactobacillus TaxID=1578 RepID=UPI000D704EB6|nr:MULTISPECIES: transcription termination factor NusA [Lactobacillus]AWN33574.1 transcription termination/antitermination protein NusA [Lactobacillus helsingborgensis]MCT6812257.1 transcription termination factor NusA [Lactobacillus helsingborgensis]MCT6827824.1 transcription termination factor NusA [Lactobacillus helsingborgensis]MCT6846689.1 transcription termination factor NusA [Lactobacillus helsingborgensis]RMC53031.1 transcription termination/antitermination protein NusA [Lactobacillus 